MTSFNATHLMLVDGPDFDFCRRRVERFFARTILVKYDSVQVIPELSCNGSEPCFHEQLAAGIAANRALAADLLAELKESGLGRLDDLATLPQGYASKTLHTMAHLLDGFFGVDSRFFNLNDDSHWISDKQQRRLDEEPTAHWLIHVEALSQSGNADQVGTLRTMPTTEE